jgi:hypothetical protein
VSTMAADQSTPHVMRRSDEPAGLCERDRRPRATQVRHLECRITKVDHSVADADYIENLYNPRGRSIR